MSESVDDIIERLKKTSIEKFLEKHFLYCGTRGITGEDLKFIGDELADLYTEEVIKLGR